MRKFWFGFLTAAVVAIAALLAAFLYVRFGFVDPRADIAMNHFERDMAMPSLDASVDRRAPEIKNPIPPDNANLMGGMKIYQTNCSSCHGDIHRPHGIFADSLYPRAPQFVEDAPDMPENQNFYIIQHGVRLSGMPAWKQTLSEQQMWQVTTFLSHMDKLPPQVSDAWKTVAGGSVDEDSPSHSSTMDMKGKKSMKMPMR